MNYAAPMSRIRAYLRTASERAADGDYEAAIIALMIVKDLVSEACEAMRGEQQRRRGLEERGK